MLLALDRNCVFWHSDCQAQRQRLIGWCEAEKADRLVGALGPWLGCSSSEVFPTPGLGWWILCVWLGGLGWFFSVCRGLERIVTWYGQSGLLRPSNSWVKHPDKTAGARLQSLEPSMLPCEGISVAIFNFSQIALCLMHPQSDRMLKIWSPEHAWNALSWLNSQRFGEEHCSALPPSLKDRNGRCPNLSMCLCVMLPSLFCSKETRSKVATFFEWFKLGGFWFQRIWRSDLIREQQRAMSQVFTCWRNLKETVLADSLLVGGLEHFLFFQIFFRGVQTTNQFRFRSSNLEKHGSGPALSARCPDRACTSDWCCRARHQRSNLAGGLLTGSSLYII